MKLVEPGIIVLVWITGAAQAIIVPENAELYVRQLLSDNNHGLDFNLGPLWLMETDGAIGNSLETRDLTSRGFKPDARVYKLQARGRRFLGSTPAKDDQITHVTMSTPVKPDSLARRLGRLPVDGDGMVAATALTKSQKKRSKYDHAQDSR